MRKSGQRRCGRYLSVGLVLLAAAPAWAADESLASRLSRLEPAVAPADEQKALSATVADFIQRRRQKLNDQHSAAWQKVAGRADWEKYRDERLAALSATLGQFPPPPRSPRVRVTGTVSGDGFRIDNLVFESRPGLWVTANLYRPENPPSSMPGILICHAHHTPKEHGELQDMGMTWARAGCLVLVMDQLGHGERRQHPFVDAQSYSKPYRVTRQDYYFRYDSGIQLHLAGDSLIGWMVWDLRRGVDLLLAQKGIDPQRLILLGAVAGGGDPAAVTGALDHRLAAVVPFNFGGPSPRPQYPYPLDQEPRWNFAGGGSWESTRNLHRSACDGFTPWLLVASIAPRRLVYAHEFGWFREGDPVWKRLQAVYGFYEAPDRLAFTFGKGDVTKRPPEGTHCTHIGALHRRMIHEAFRRWFAIDVSEAKEYSNRLPPEKLRCWTAAAEGELRPGKLTDLLGPLVQDRLGRARRERADKPPAEQRRLLQAGWTRLLGNVQPGKPAARRVGSEKAGNVNVERVLLTVEPGVVIPLLVLSPRQAAGAKLPVVVLVSQAGKGMLRDRAADLARLLDGGAAVCLPDLRGTGESNLSTGRGRNSAATALSSSLLMLGEPLLAGQLRDLRTVLAWLRSRPDFDPSRIALWGDSPAAVNPPETNFAVPRDDDRELPAQSEPMGGLLVLLAALYDESVPAVCVRGGLVSFESVLAHHLALVPHDVVLPGVLTVGDLPDLAAALAPRGLRLEGTVDGLNRRLSEALVRQAYRLAGERYAQSRADAVLSIDGGVGGGADWLLARLKPS